MRGFVGDFGTDKIFVFFDLLAGDFVVFIVYYLCFCVVVLCGDYRAIFAKIFPKVTIHIKNA